MRWQRRIAAALHPLGLTHVQFVLLAAVWWLSTGAQTTSGLPNQRQVAGHADVDVMMTSQVLRALEVRGLVARRADPDDGRVYRLSVTEAGALLAEQAIALVDAADADFCARAHDPDQLLELLHLLAHEPKPIPG